VRSAPEAAAGPPPGPTLLESALRHDRLIVGGGLGLVTAASWWWILAMSTDMYGAMSGASAWAMTRSWDGRHLALLFAMWAVMMAAMMLPGTVPTMLLYVSVARRADPLTYARRAYVLALGYLAVWSVFSGAAALGQRVLATSALLSPMMVLTDRRAGAALLALVAAYQFTPLKRTCLDACRSPVDLITRHWRPGTRGALSMGIRYGLQCLGCCWTLMLLLFAGGVMNAVVIAGLTSFVLIEKVSPWGVTASRAGGVLLAVLAIALLSL
jgi:predicted metal-binding membrane protein